MVWSKIKKAINSTLGTKDFKPLDKIVEDSFLEVVEKQNEMKNALETGDNNFIASFVKNGANIEIGVYEGTGTYGWRNPNSLTFSFEPKLVIIKNGRRHYEMILIKGMPCGTVGGSPFNTEEQNEKLVNRVTWNGKTVSWYNAENEDYQLNNDNVYYGGENQYYYIAIGKMGE